VSSEVCDHTSVIRLLEQRFEFRCPNITPWRRAICGDLLAAFDFGAPDRSLPALPATLPFDVARDAACRARPEPQVPLVQTLPTVEPGLRRSRALPYRFGVQARPIGGALQLRYDNDGPRGVVCAVQDRRRPASAPRRHTLGGHSHLVEEVATAEGIDLEVTAVNGFRRRFVQQAGAASFGVIEVADRLEGRLRLVLRSQGPVTVTISDRLAGAPLRELHIGLDRGTSLDLDLVAQGFWYDLVIASADGGCRWEAGGRLECGIDSWSDPRPSA
jgi:phospholipase C